MKEPFEDHEATAELSSDSLEKQHFRTFRALSSRLDNFGVEIRGIERVPPYERTTNPGRHFVSASGLWLAAAGGLSSMSAFLLGPLVYELGLRQSLLVGQIGNLLGCLVAAYLLMMGPKLGCRQMVGARYLFGWYFVRLIALCAIIGVMGWLVVNSVVGGQILSAVSNGKVLVVVGIIIVLVVSLVVAIFGIKQVLRTETMIAFPVTLAMGLMYICINDKYLEFVYHLVAPDHATMIGNSFSFALLAYSTTATWGSIASDYYLLFPETTPDWQVFTLTFFGVFLPTAFVGILGTLLGNIALGYLPWGDVYGELGMGGLLVEAFNRWNGGGKFLSMCLFLLLISNNIINTYLAAFGFQLGSSYCRRIPRWFWAFVVTGITLVAALVGRNHFATILGNFLPMIGYWISMYFILLVEENTIFRRWCLDMYTKEFEVVEDEAPSRRSRKTNYNWAIWNDQSRLTLGLAASASAICGAVGAALSMSQTYYVGPIAKKVGGEYGGDLGMWVSMGIAGVLYPGLRWLELKRFGR